MWATVQIKNSNFYNWVFSTSKFLFVVDGNYN